MKNVDAAAYLETMYGLMKKYYVGLNMHDKCREAVDKAKTLLYNTDDDINMTSTIYGYNIDCLTMIAKLSAAKGISPDDLIDLLSDAEKLIQAVYEEQKNSIEKAIQIWT